LWRHLYRRDYQGRFPKLFPAWLWVASMVTRVQEGTPPISEADFNMLADWFNANRERISASVDLDGRTQRFWGFGLMIDQGYRRLFERDVFEDLLQHKAQLDPPAQPAPNPEAAVR
jgi:hypothetical protein